MKIDDITVLCLILWLAALIFIVGYLIHEKESFRNAKHPEWHPYLSGETSSSGNSIVVGMDSKAESNSTAIAMGRVVKRGEHVDVKYVDGSFVTTVVPDNDNENMANS